METAGRHCLVDGGGVEDARRVQAALVFAAVAWNDRLLAFNLHEEPWSNPNPEMAPAQA